MVKITDNSYYLFNGEADRYRRVLVRRHAIYLIARKAPHSARTSRPGSSAESFLLFGAALRRKARPAAADARSHAPPALAGVVVSLAVASATGDVVTADGGQAEGGVLSFVLLASGRKKPRSMNRSATASTWSRLSPAPAQPGCDDLTDAGQGGAELPYVIVFGLVSFLAPAVVVPVLPAPGGVSADGLDVAAGVRRPGVCTETHPHHGLPSLA
jgi:hypothetical protein